MAIAVRHAQHLGVLGGWMSGLLGTYSVVLNYGAYRVHRRFAATDPESCAAPSNGLLQTLHQIFIAPPPGLLLDGPSTASALPSKVSLVLLPGFCLACAALLVWRSRPRVHTLQQQTVAVDTVSLAWLQREAKTLLERANLGRLLSNVFAVLFLWRMSTFHRQLGAEGTDDNNEPRARFLRLWFSFALLVAGLGLLLGLLNLALYGAMQTQYRNMKHAIRLRVRAPTSGLRGGGGRAGVSSSAFTGL